MWAIMAKNLYKKRKGRRAYLDDFQINEEGAYEYTGGRYVYPGGDLPSQKRRLLIYGGIMLASVIGGGCLPAPGLNAAVVLIPYALTLIFAVNSCRALFRLCKGGNPMRAYVYKESVARLPKWSLITAVSAGASLTGEILFVIRYGYWKGLLRAPGFFLCLMITFLSSIFLNRASGNMKWEKERKDTP